jgi:hypothetical protein
MDASNWSPEMTNEEVFEMLNPNGVIFTPQYIFDKQKLVKDLINIFNK